MFLPIHVGREKYLGNVSFVNNGAWVVSDSVKYRGRFIVSNPPPKFFFDIH
jgi:hypothetical protein